MKIPLNFGGGGGSGSDDCTATASDVLESKTAIYNGSDDEPEYGTMKDYSGTTTSATATNNSSNSRVELTVPNTGKYDTSAKLYSSYSDLSSTVGLTAAKIATGNTIMGVTGSYTGLGSATQAQVLSGKTFSTASLSNASGTMTDKSGTSTAATSSVSGSNYRLAIPTNGYYNTSAYLTNSYSNTASTIGLTAAKLKSGESVLGLTGSWSGYVAESGDLYYYGTVGSLAGGVTFLSAPSYIGSYRLDPNCITLYIYGANGAGGQRHGFIFNNNISLADYSTLTMTYSVMMASSSNAYNGEPSLNIATYSSKPSSYEDLGNCVAYNTVYLPSQDLYNTLYTLSLSVTTTGSRYIGVFLRHRGYGLNVNITRIRLT